MQPEWAVSNEAMVWAIKQLLANFQRFSDYSLWGIVVVGS
jgi:hypothetical protein